MEKAKFNKEETKNLLGMLKSTDSENHVIAFQALENADLSKYHGELLVLYKYGKISHSVWEKEAPKAWAILATHVTSTNNPISLTSGKCLSILTDTKASRESIELYLENFVGDMVVFLDQLGYPSDKFTIDIKLKE